MNWKMNARPKMEGCDLFILLYFTYWKVYKDSMWIETTFHESFFECWGDITMFIITNSKIWRYVVLILDSVISFYDSIDMI